MEIWPTDLDFGIFGYHYDGKTIGGKIKEEPENFIVTEVDPKSNQPIAFPPEKLVIDDTKEEGLFLIGRVWKRQLDHARMVRLIAKEFRVKQTDVSTSGIKDANAITVQLFSVYQPKRRVNDPTQIVPGLEIDSFHYTREYLWPGSMGGNKFNIKITDTMKIEEKELNSFSDWVSQGILNYYGYQRFGSHRPITAQFGRLIATGKYKNALDLYLGGKSAYPEDEKFRKQWRDDQNPEELLAQWHNIPYTEKSLLEYLCKRPHDYIGAAKRFPDFLIKLAKSSFISLLTNHYFSRRGVDKDILPGERRKEKNIEIALPSKEWNQPLNDIWREVFDYAQVDIKKELKQIRHTTRLLVLYPQNWKINFLSEDTINVEFQLPNGAYATTVLRELMQQPPSAFF